jgi:mannose-6-phosphate isomerase-like protein (cupin superfamily)
MMAEVSIVGPDEGESLSLGPATQMRILEDGSTTRHRLGVAVSTIAPHTAGPPQHRHTRHEEGFYVVSGTMRFTVGERDHDVAAGGFVMVPVGAPHTFSNPGDAPAVLLSTFTPDLYVQYFRDLRDAAATGHATSSDLEAIMAHYATEHSTEYAP